MKKTLVFMAMGIGLLLTQEKVAMACTCLVEPPTLVKLKDSNTVFVGIAGNTDDREVTFKTTEMIKGDNKPSITVDRGGDSCMVFFEQGKEYLVYTYLGEGNTLSTNACSGDRLKEEAEREIKILKGGGKWYQLSTKSLLIYLFSALLILFLIKLLVSGFKSGVKK